MFDPKHLHIAVASDENYARFVASLMLSVIDNNRCFDKITFHLLSNRISHTSIDKLKSITSDNNELCVYDISDLESRLDITVPTTIAITSYARLFLNRIIDARIDRILYLDTDIIVVDNLAELWESNPGNNMIGGCLDVFDDTTTKTDIGLNVSDPYINAGVLLINLKQWREENADRMFVDFLLAHDGNVHHHDQGIINGTCKGRTLLLPPQYNMHSTVFSHSYKLISHIIQPYYEHEKFDKALLHPAIIHFTEGYYNRPWKKNCKHPYRASFIKYESMGPWSGTPLLPDNRSMALRILSYSFLNFPYSMYRCISSIVSYAHKILKR